MTTQTERSQLAPVTNPVNAAALRQYLNYRTYDDLRRFAQRAFFDRYHREVKQAGVWKKNLTGAAQASEVVNEAILRVLDSDTPYRDNPRAMGDFLMQAIRNVVRDGQRRVSLERQVHAAMVAATIIDENAEHPRATAPTMQHGDDGDGRIDDSIVPTPFWPDTDSGPIDPRDRAFAAPHVDPGPDQLARVIELQERDQLYSWLVQQGISQEDWLDWQRVVEDGQPASLIAKERGKAVSTITRRFAKITRLLEERAKTEGVYPSLQWGGGESKMSFKGRSTGRSTVDATRRCPRGKERRRLQRLAVALAYVAPHLMGRS